MYRNFVAWATGNSSSVGPLTQYANNEIYKELIKYEKYYKKAESHEKLYVDLRRGRGYTSELEKVDRNDPPLTLTITLRAAATKKNEIEGSGILSMGIFIFHDKFRLMIVIQRLWNSCTKRNGCVGSLKCKKYIDNQEKAFHC